jgi:hypothetical protein
MMKNPLIQLGKDLIFFEENAAADVPNIEGRIFY